MDLGFHEIDLGEKRLEREVHCHFLVPLPLPLDDHVVLEGEEHVSLDFGGLIDLVEGIRFGLILACRFLSGKH